MKKIFEKAHKMTREMVKEYGVDYRAQFALNLSYLLGEKEEKEMKFDEIKKMAEENGLEAVLWQKYGLTKIYFNYYTGSGYRKNKGQFNILEDGTITVDKTGKYPEEVAAIWNAIPEGAKLEIA
jgi:hypothetical protein